MRAVSDKKGKKHFCGEYFVAKNNLPSWVPCNIKIMINWKSVIKAGKKKTN